MSYAHHTRRRGFTLLEIMVVVIIIGALLAMAIPGFNAVRERTRVSAFLNDFRAVKEAVNRYNLEEGGYPVDGGTGQPTPEFLEYIREDIIMDTTVIGGNWTADVTNYTFAFGVTGYEVDDEIIEQIDEGVDDGDITTGAMTKTGDGVFYFVIEE